MPKTFTESERVFIRERLMEEASECLKQYGLRKTTVDELVRRVNIPKGTFYLFYESKELLFFEVFNKLHDEIHADVLKRLGTLQGPVTAEQVTELILHIYTSVEDTFMFEFITAGDMELLIRRLPPEVAKAHALKDDLSVEGLVRMAPNVKPSEIGAYSGAFRAIFLSMLHKREIGEEVFKDALRLMIRGVVDQMFGEASQ